MHSSNESCLGPCTTRPMSHASGPLAPHHPANVLLPVVLHHSLGPAGVTIELFAGAVLLLRRGDGACMHVAASPQPALLHLLAKQGQWDRAMKLARCASCMMNGFMV